MNEKFHLMEATGEMPERFTFPFNYRPHPLALKASGELQRYIAGHDSWRKELWEGGKMFGVLVVRSRDGALGFLAAYSGLLQGRNDWKYFVPPVVDSQQPDGYFKTEERRISAVNARIAALQTDTEYRRRLESIAEMQREADAEIAAFRRQMAEAKERRNEMRQSGRLTDEEAKRLIGESQYQKAELRRLKKRWQERIDGEKATAATSRQTIAGLKEQRRQASDALQRWLFSQYQMLNARGERRPLQDIFANTPQRVPPSGAGDCCAPKLLQYAYSEGMTPLCMAEFWWGRSPLTEVRHHLAFYPACHAKCKPILGHMLQGLNVDPDPHDAQYADAEDELRIVYEDASVVVVDKPSGMLSVPGNVMRQCVTDVLRRKRGAEAYLEPAHRLDMATSGLLIVAKSEEALRQLHEQFASRKVQKRYRAVLDGVPHVPESGTIRLPLAADPIDRPRQIVDYEHGKEAATDYRILSVSGGKTEILLWPHTGRTHQLRLHCAHADGLGVPIVGDGLYGRGGDDSDRLMLRAEYVAFQSPATGKEIVLSEECSLIKFIS